MLFAAGNFACEKTEIKNIPVEFTEYSLEGTECQWKNLGYDGKVIIINNSDELEKYITSKDGNIPYVDFSKQTLLLASDSDKDVKNIDAAFFKSAANQYTVKVSIRYGDAAVMTNWTLAILTSKIPDASILALEKENNKLSLKGTKWKLEGIVNEQTGTMQVLEPTDCEQCYTLEFDTDTTGFGKSSTNQMWINLNHPPFIGIMTLIGEIPDDGYFFVNVLPHIKTFEHQNDTLKFFYQYENANYYLLYKKTSR
jgi:hypothetical protein